MSLNRALLEKRARTPPITMPASPDARLTAARSFLHILFRKAQDITYWADSRILKDFQFATEVDRTRTEGRGCPTPAHVVQFILTTIAGLDAETILRYMNGDLAALGIPNVDLVFEGNIEETPLDEHHGAQHDAGTAKPQPKRVVLRSLYLFKSLLELKTMTQDRDFTTPLSTQELRKLEKLAHGIIARSPHVLYHGHPVLMIVLTILPPSRCVQYLADAGISVSPSWYNDMVEDMLTAFVYRGLMPSMRLAYRTFVDVAGMLQGSKQEDITLSHGLKMVLEGQNTWDIIVDEKEPARKRRQTCLPQGTAVAGIRSSEVVLDDEAVAFAYNAGLEEKDVRISVEVEKMNHLSHTSEDRAGRKSEHGSILYDAATNVSDESLDSEFVLDNLEDTEGESDFEDDEQADESD